MTHTDLAGEMGPWWMQTDSARSRQGEHSNAILPEAAVFKALRSEIKPLVETNQYLVFKYYTSVECKDKY